MARRLTFILALAIAVSAASAPSVRAAAAVTIVNSNAPGVGFNDPTPAVPVGGNPGTTLGQQRLIVFQYAAQKWGDTLDSSVPVLVQSTMEPLACTATSAVLGSAGALSIFANFTPAGLSPGPLYPNAWHGGALADKRAGYDLDPGFPDIRARFNSNLGNAGCLTGTRFYLGLDANHGANIDLAAVVLHEISHGLGFQQFASVSTGARILDLNDVYNIQIFDNTTLKTWGQMTNAERAASAINSRRVVFQGPAVSSAVPAVLQLGTPLLRVLTPASVAGVYSVGAAAFGPPLSAPGITANTVVGRDASNAAGPSTTDACTALTNAAEVASKFALVDRGTCGFAVKVKNAQNAGALGVIVADNVAGGPPAGLGGADATIVIPSVRITLADGNAIKARLTAGDVVATTLGVDPSVRAGADVAGFAMLNTPNPVQPGSSISHWDPIAAPNQLMEPSINGDLTHAIAPPADLTLPLMRDVGWFPDADLDGAADAFDTCPTSDLRPTVIIGGEDTGVANVLFTSGCTITDLVLAQSVGAGNHGKFVSGVAHLTNDLKAAGIITGAEKGRIQSAAAHASLP